MSTLACQENDFVLSECLLDAPRDIGRVMEDGALMLANARDFDSSDSAFEIGRVQAVFRRRFKVSPAVAGIHIDYQ